MVATPGNDFRNGSTNSAGNLAAKMSRTSRVVVRAIADPNLEFVGAFRETPVQQWSGFENICIQ
ncbi:hypothetical protein H6G89_06455 [Oscillatoria sp. FACHB-1407]|uniref:hypothetical protein n=1 Tax=Oscillatoria sp. FACHB-1407 TaxID=2692847 RepID=UPI001687C2B7|nr:hypothetical protein [Oscillatoria sp. FACHB-1407]MBD2460681.1 hypothetical protein [Oscillatoria sp. FACHB-1407]